MLKSFSIRTVVVLALVFSGCSGRRAPEGQPPLPVATVRTATMDVTPGLKLLARIELPDGFTPAPFSFPMWLQSGKEVGVAGIVKGRAVVMGYGGAGWSSERVIAEDGGAGLADGHIVDLSPSPDGMALAMAVEYPAQKRIDVMVRDLISAGNAHSVSSFDGEFDGASIGWVDQFTIALALRGHEGAQARPASDGSAKIAESGLYLVAINGMVTADFLK